MALKDMRLTGTTAAGGGVNVTGDAVFGWLYAVEWIDGDLADGVDAVLSCTVTGSAVDQTILTLTNANDDAWYYPRAEEHDNAGSGLGTYNYPVLNGTPKLAITDGGATKTGGCILYYFT